MTLLRVVQLLAQTAILREVSLLARRPVIDHPLRNLPHDSLDQSEVQHVVVLCIIAHTHTHRLEQQVAGEQLHGDAPHAPNIRLLVPLHAQQHLGRAVLACVDGAFPTLIAVCRAAVVDHYVSRKQWEEYMSRRHSWAGAPPCDDHSLHLLVSRFRSELPSSSFMDVNNRFSSFKSVCVSPNP